MLFFLNRVSKSIKHICQNVLLYIHISSVQPLFQFQLNAVQLNIKVSKRIQVKRISVAWLLNVIIKLHQTVHSWQILQMFNDTAISILFFLYLSMIYEFNRINYNFRRSRNTYLFSFLFWFYFILISY